MTPSAISRTDAAALAAAVFVDKDGTLIEDVPYNVDPAHVRFTPHALEGLRSLADAGYRLFIVTNQPGLALGRFAAPALERLQAAIAATMQEAAAPLAGFYFCPHAPVSSPSQAACPCRKPAPGLLRQAARKHRLDLRRCWMVGDILDDVEAGRRAGCRTILLDVGNETEWRLTPERAPDFRAANLLEAARMIRCAGSQPPGDAAAGMRAGTKAHQ